MSTRIEAIKATELIHPDNLDQIAKIQGVASAMKLRSDCWKVINAYDLNADDDELKNKNQEV